MITKMLPQEIIKIKEEIKAFIDNPALDKALSQKICDEVMDYCKNERKDMPNYKCENGKPFFESARSTMQLVFNMVADDNYMFHNYKTIEDERFERFGFKSALKELETAESKGMWFYEGDPWAEWEKNLPDFVKDFSQSEEMKDLFDEFMLKMGEAHLDDIIKPKEI